MSYRDLKSYQQATIIYDFTVEFCDRYIDKKSRTTDQMVQAARSGKQNIVEGSTERTSKKSELYLLGVARASFQELLEDFEDFLRQRSLTQWGKNDLRALEVRNLYKSNQSYQSNQTDRSDWTNRSYLTYKSYLTNSEIAANVAICLINQANFLLDRQIKALESQFIEKGGWSENLRHQREEEKKRKLKKFLL